MIYVVGVIVAVVVGVLVAWIVIVTALRLLSWIVAFGVLVTVAMFVAGVVSALVIPFLVLRNRLSVKAETATPKKVHDGEIVPSGPGGEADEYGWDEAWPLYMPYQSRLDHEAVFAQARVLRRTVRSLAINARAAMLNVGAIKQQDLARSLLTPVPWLLLDLPALGFLAGNRGGIFLWGAVMKTINGVAFVVEKAMMTCLDRAEKGSRRRRKAELRCVKCYRVSTTPSYECSNQRCTIVHHSLRPGPLGVRRRICGCGTHLPTTVTSAADVLGAVCPYCKRSVPKGSGTRSVVVMPAFGPVGVGKTQFLASLGVGLVEVAKRRPGGELTPLTREAESFLRSATDSITAGTRLNKTPYRDKPEGVPLALKLDGEESEIHLMDAAGESFADQERSRDLSYIDYSETLMCLVDPLALPEVGERLGAISSPSGLEVATGDPNDAYGSVVDRLRAEGVDLRGKCLAIVVTKADVVSQLPSIDPLPEGNSDAVREWLVGHGADRLVRRIAPEFKQVSYFAVDSRDGLAIGGARHPLRVADWALDAASVNMQLIEQGSSDEAA